MMSEMDGELKEMLESGRVEITAEKLNRFESWSDDTVGQEEDHF